MAEKKLKVGVFSMDGIGHIAACIGVMQPLLARGHDVFFIANEEHRGKFEKFGAREKIVVSDLSPEERETKASAAREAGERMLKSGLLSSKSSYEKSKLMLDVGFLQLLIKQIKEQDQKLANILNEERPDLIIIDHIIISPCFILANIPWVMIHSPSPLFVYRDDRLPPAFSGYSLKNPDPVKWKEFAELSEAHFFGPVKEVQLKMFEDAKIEYPESLYGNLIMSPYLNVYAFPKEMDYTDVVPRPKNVFQIDAFSREMPKSAENELQLPDDFINREDGIALIYLSMGSMGGADVDLMKRLVAIISESKHKFIVVKGPRGDEYELNSPNIVGGNFLSQTVLLPKCDLVITHGGNNSTTEAFFAGKPLIVMPLFADQFDNATRVTECGFGLQFNPYLVQKDELFEAIDKLLNDDQLKARLEAASKRLLKDNLKEKLAIKLEQIAAEGYKKL